MTTSLPIRTCFSFIPFSYLPETTRINATLSRCFGSILAWILNTKPLNFSSALSTVLVSAWRDCGFGAHCVKPSRKWSTPKLPNAVPKNTGVSSPLIKAYCSNSLLAPCTNSNSSRSCCAKSSPTAASNSGLFKPLTMRTSWMVEPCPDWYK